MGWRITDGKGRANDAGVTDDNRLTTDSKSNNRSFYVSRDEGRLFSWTSIAASVTAGEFILSLRNESEGRRLYVDHVEIGGVNTALWKVHRISGTPAGNTITASNFNLTKDFPADATSFGNVAVTGMSSTALLEARRSTADGFSRIDFNSNLILGENDTIAVEYDTGVTGIGEVTLVGYFEIEEVF